MKSVLISGSFNHIEVSYDVVDFINDNLVKEYNIAFVASDFYDYYLNDKFVDKLLTAFKDKKMFFNDVFVIDSRNSKNNMIDKLKKSNIVFLLGGDTLKQIKSINEYELKEYIVDIDKIVIGISAGAINMAEKVVLARDIDDNIPELSIYEGLGITNINIEPHCDFNNKVHWEDLVEASMYTSLVVMHDDAYIIIDDNNVNYFGHYFILKNGVIYFNGKKSSLDEFLKDIDYLEDV